MRITPISRETSIIAGDLYFEDVRQCAVESETFHTMIDERYITSIRCVSLSYRWQQTVQVTVTDRIVETINTEFTLRKETRSGRNYWYAYRRVHGTLYKKFVGQSDEVTEEKLLAIARKLPTSH